VDPPRVEIGVEEAGERRLPFEVHFDRIRKTLRELANGEGLANLPGSPDKKGFSRGVVSPCTQSVLNQASHWGSGGRVGFLSAVVLHQTGYFSRMFWLDSGRRQDSTIATGLP